jgi:hypothetical protein
MHRKFIASPTLRTQGCGPVPGIIIHGRCSSDQQEHGPRIQAFVWGGKVPAAPGLNYGRRKDVA